MIAYLVNYIELSIIINFYSINGKRLLVCKEKVKLLNSNLE